MTGPKLRLAALAIAALAIGGAGAARADSASRSDASPPTAASDDRRHMVGVLEIRVEGLPDEVKEGFQQGLERQLDTKRYWLLSRARLKQLMLRSTRWTEGCLVGACLRELRAQSGADLVLLAALTGATTSFGYVVTLVRTDTGRVLDQAADRCEVCTVNEAIASATQATVALVARASDRLTEGAPADDGDGGGPRRGRRLGAVLTAVGLAAVAGGLALYYGQDRPTYAAMTASAGGALAAGGLIVLAF